MTSALHGSTMSVMRRRPSTILAWVLLFETMLHGIDPAIRLDGVPEQVTFPIREGAPHRLRATVDGAAIDAAWIAAAADAKGRVPLTRERGGGFVIDLAEPSLLALLPEGQETCLYVFGRTRTGSVVESSSIKAAMRTRPIPQSPILRIFRAKSDQYEILAPSWHSDPSWHDPHSVSLLEVELPRSDASRSCWITIGAIRLDFAALAEPARFKLRLGDEQRAAWQAAGRLSIEESAEGSAGVCLATLCARPRTIGATRPIAFDAMQRRAAVVPETCEYLLIELGDITRGQVQAELRTAESEVLVSRASFAAGDSAAFLFRDSRCELRLVRLHNFLVGEDRAEFRIERIQETAAEQIDRLLEIVVRSDVRFIRNDVEHSGAEAAEHLRKKYLRLSPRPSSIEEFIDLVGTRSTLSGSPYLVKHPDGSVQPAAQWLRERSAAILGALPPRNAK